MQEMNWQKLSSSLNGDENTSATPGAGTEIKRRGRKPKGTTDNVTITKAMIVDILTVVNMPIQISGYGAYALSAVEIDKLAEAWHRVIKQNPYVAKYLVGAGKLGVWGNLLFVHAQVIGARLELYSAQQDAKRPATRAATPIDPKPMRSELLS